MSATLLWFSGAETGGVSEFPDVNTGCSIVASPVRSGTYALSTPTTRRAIVAITGLGSSTYLRCYFKIGANPSAAQVIVGLGTTTTDKFQVWLNTDGTVGWSFGTFPAGPTASGAGVVSLSAWNKLEVHYLRDATVGGMDIYLNDALQTSDFTIATTSGTSATTMKLQFGDVEGIDGGQTIYWDDMAFGTGGYIGTGQSLAVQGKAGAVTYDAWTKSSGATAHPLWSETPYGAANNCHSVVSGDQQTMLAAPTGLAAGATVNGAFLLAVASCASSFSTVKLMRRVGVTDTISGTKSTSTVAGVVPRGVNAESMDVFVDTVANMDAMEIGAQANDSSIANTVDDIWLLVDYVPAPPVTITILTAPPLEALGWTAYRLPTPMEARGQALLEFGATAPLEARGWAKLAVPLSVESWLALRNRITLAFEIIGGPPDALVVEFRVAAPTFDPLRVLFSVRESGEVMGALDVTFDVLEACDAGLEVTFFVLQEALFNLRMHETLVAPHVEVRL